MPPKNNRLPRLITSLILLTLPFVIFLQRWNIYDSWRLNGYNPDAQVVQLATDTVLTEKGKHLFYVYHPELEDKDTFRQNCTSAEQTIVLGCFIEFKGIFLQNITDERLTGVQQVTAAHEMLHAGYERLSPSEKQRIDKLLNDTFAKINDERLNKTVEDYKKSGADITNELHSILPTEHRELSPELEQYYKQYFSNRLKVVEYSERYEAAFTSRKNQVAAYDQQLADIKRNIDANNAQLETKQQELQARQRELDRLLAQHKNEEYNSAVPGYNSLVQSYNYQVNVVRGLIDTYNALVNKRNAIALEEGELVKAIDSRPSTVQSE